ncbi:MAG: NUDIX domain-containing protein [Treponema sp.]|nr:NUDIX domain-containing protein [Treponema sp.]
MVDKIQMVGCAFLPLNRDNKKILISKRSMHKKHFPGLWEVIGGNLEFGEDFEDCVIREVQEEINAGIKHLEHLHSRAMYLNNLMYITVAYYGELLDEPVFNKEEISEIKWISKEELENFEFCPGDVDLLKMGFEKLEK